MRPTSTMMRLRTVAKTGRRMEMSESDKAVPLALGRSGTARRRCRRLHLDRGTIADLERTGSDDAVAAREAVHDLHLAGVAGAQADRRHAGHELVRLVAEGELEDDLLAALRDQRLLGHPERLGLLVQGDGDAGEQAGAQAGTAGRGRVRVVDPGADDDGPALLVDERVQREDLALEPLVREGVDPDLDPLRRAGVAEEGRQEALGHAEVHLLAAGSARD